MADFDKQPGESETAYRAARRYFELGPGERSLSRVAELLGYAGRRHLQGWSVKFDWVRRASVWDEDKRRRDEEAQERAREESAAAWAERREQARERAWTLAEKLMDRAETMLNFPLHTTTTQDGKTTIKPAKWTLRTAASFLEAAAKLQTIATTAPEGTDTGPLTIRVEYAEDYDQIAAPAPGTNEGDS